MVMASDWCLRCLCCKLQRILAGGLHDEKRHCCKQAGTLHIPREHPPAELANSVAQGLRIANISVSRQQDTLLHSVSYDLG